MPELNPTTSTGAEGWAVLPSPSWPSSLAPQHLTPPAVVSAHVWARPAAIAIAVVPRPPTSTGTGLSVVPPLPSWPVPLLPQHFTPPEVVNAQLWLAPAASA